MILDVFNEPRAQADPGPLSCGQADTWKLWQQGGRTAQGTTYVGMQQLVDGVRDEGATNLLWVEGPCWASTLSKVASYRITGGPLVYDFHHPGGGAPHTAAEWHDDFGFLVEGGIAPVVDGEWTNRASGDSSNCWSDAPTAVPNYLSYLAAHHLGMVAFQLTPGFMVTDNENNFTDTTRVLSTWRCDDPNLNQGAGALVMAWFKQHNDTPGS